VLASAGTGKSRLVREFLASIAEGATILRGRCLNYGDGITYWALGEILRAAAGVEEVDEPAIVRARVEALVAADRDATRVAGIASVTVAREPASADGIAWAVRRPPPSAAERPLVVLVEDIHWAEPALLDLLEAIVDWSQGAPILIVCPARPELLEARIDWGAGRPNAAILHLEPLDPALASALIDVLPGGHVLPAGLRARSWKRPRATRSSSRSSGHARR
jgi:predicted ATPase